MNADERGHEKQPEVTAETLPEQPATAKPAGRRGRLRGALVVALVVLCSLATVMTGVALWTHNTVLDTEGYMRLVAPVGKDPQAVRSLSDYVAGQVLAATELEERTATALPPKAQFLAQPIAMAVDRFIADEVYKLLSTPQAYRLWLAINRIAHKSIVGLLRGENTYTYIAGNDVKLDTLPLISQALVWIDGKLPGGLGSRFSPPVIEPGTPPAQAVAQVSQWSGKQLPADFGQLTLLKSDSLGPAERVVRFFDTIVVVLPILTLALAAAAVGLSRHRRRTLIELGIAAAAALILTRVLVKQASEAIVNDLHSGGGTISMIRDVVGAALDPLTTITIWIVIIGVVVAFAAWISGRRDVQVAVVTAGRRVVEGRGGVMRADSAATAWVKRYADVLRVAGLAAGLILLAFATSSWAGVIVVVVLTLVYEGALSLLAGGWPFGRRDTGGDAPA